jgi:acyl carrier protein
MAKKAAETVKEQPFFKVSSKTELEEEILRIWRDVLGLDRVGVNDNFFEIGGHSLLMIEISSKIGELLEKKFSATDLCRYPTIGSLAEYLTRQHHG